MAMKKMSSTTHDTDQNVIIYDSDSPISARQSDAVHVIPHVIFVCKSNTCRSQMAEGWAKDWIRKRLETKHRSGTCSDPILLRKELSYFTSLVASAALDSCSVYDEVPIVKEECSKCCEGMCETPALRKRVKEKAIKTMQELGVEMSSSYPKTIDEVLYSSIQTPEMTSTYLYSPVVEKLIIMCDCNTPKDAIISQAKSVEEWQIDAPTAAVKAGEVTAYRRVSLEIKLRVDDLMETMFGDEINK